MIKDEKKLENAAVELEIEVPGNRVEIEYKSVFNKIQTRAKVDGFRQGKAPLEIVERKFQDLADQEVVENVCKAVYLDAISEKQYTPIGMPEFDFAQKIARGSSFVFKVKFEIPPTVELAEYKGLGVEERDCKVSDEDVNNEIQSMREKNAAISKKPEGEAAMKGDLVRVQVKRIDNIEKEEIEKTDFKDYTIIIGKSKEDLTFDQHITGMKAGEEKEVELKYPKDYKVKDLAGQKARYILKLAEVSKMDLPALDDEFARDLGEYSSLGDLKAKIRQDLEGFVKERSKMESKGKLLKEIVEKSKFDIPLSLIEKEMGAIFQKVQERVGFHAQDINEFTSTLGINPEEFHNKMKEEAKYSIQTTLVLTEIAKKDELKASEEQYKKVIETIARRNNKSAEEIDKIVSERNARENIESEIILETAQDVIYDSARVKKLKAVTLEKFLGGEEQKD